MQLKKLIVAIAMANVLSYNVYAGNKVSVCHNNRMLSVDDNAVPAYLAHSNNYKCDEEDESDSSGSDSSGSDSSSSDSSSSDSSSEDYTANDSSSDDSTTTIVTTPVPTPTATPVPTPVSGRTHWDQIFIN